MKRSILLTMALCALSTAASAQTHYWIDAGTDWLTAANWSTNGAGGVATSTTPGMNDEANLPSDGTIDNFPTLNGNAAVRRLYIDNGGQDYSIAGFGTLAVGADGITGTRADFFSFTYPTFEVDLLVQGDQTWNLSSSGSGNYWHTGNLGGTGTVTLTGAGNGGDYIYRNSDEPTHRGNFIVEKRALQWELLGQSASRTVTFGTAPDGISRKTITLDGGAFGLFAESDTTPTPDLEVDNPITVTDAGGGLQFGQSRVDGSDDYSHCILSGDIDMGGPLSVLGAGAGSDPTVSGNITLSQHEPSRLVLTQIDADAELTGSIVDGPGSAANPLILGSTDLRLTIAGASNTYGAGTVIDHCGSQNHHDEKQAHIYVDAASCLGSGDVTVLPGGALLLSSATNITTGSKVHVQANDVAQGVVSLGYYGPPTFLSPESSGVLGINIGLYESITNLAEIGNGYMFLGAVRGWGTFNGPVLGPGAGNVYRLGGGVQQYAQSPEVDIMLGCLADDNGTALQVGSPKWHGNGCVELNSANSFTGPIDVWGMSYYRSTATLHHYWPQATLRARTQVTGNALGSTEGPIHLHNAALEVLSIGSIHTQTVARGEFSFEGLSRVRLQQNHTSYRTYCEFDLSPTSRVNRGILRISGNNGLALPNARVQVGSNNPTETHGMLPPYFLAYPDFATYEGSTDANGEFGFSNFTAYVTMPAAGTGTEVVQTGALDIPDTRDIYALKADGALTGAGTITIRGGGLLMGNGCNISPDLDFDTAEGVIFKAASGGGGTISGTISGSDGITVASQANVGELTVASTANDFTGPVTVMAVPLRVPFDTTNTTTAAGLGHSNNNILLNGGMLIRYNSGDRLLASRTLTLGPVGGFVSAGGSTVYGQITGPGSLTVIASEIILDNESVVSPNDYGGGTLVDRTYGSKLTVEGETKAGTGDLSIEHYGIATLKGNTNLASDAQVYVAMYGKLNLEGAAPELAGLNGVGDVAIGTGSSSCSLTLGGDDSSSTFYGEISESSSSYPGSVTKDGNGTFTLYGVHGFTGDMTVSEGKLVLMGSVAGNVVVTAGGTLAGRGIVHGDLTLDGALEVELGETFSGLAVGGNVLLGGTLNVSFAEGYEPEHGTEWTLVNGAGSVDGTFSGVTDGFSVSVQGSNVVLSNPAQGLLLIVR